ncbi:unnamed protein product [Adineta ricciae]|uniref:G-protein coupled receptors family 1 profile domain-containing protein n=1 Tax=Adineta ricciae TaxID=249248 RepID=A0A813SNJ7_ADIRI|nr:unnamed protein product [Adineta ricciae]CAF1462218.1 unnamed protein product [Adineta ricciae]
MSSTTELVRSLTIYAGIPIFTIGTIGNLLNVRCLWRTRRNPCAFIFISLSLINCLVLFYGLFTRILGVGFNLDWATSNVIWCKCRAAFSQAVSFMSLTCVCLASIDRYFASCREEKYRRLSRLSYAICAVLLTCVFWLLHSIPDLIYGTIARNAVTGVVTCTSSAPKDFINYQIYVSLPMYLGVFPALILIASGLFTYRNTSQLQAERQREVIQKQLTKMMLVQIPIILVSTLPYIVFTEYAIFSATTAKSTAQRATESILSNSITLLFYLSFATSFFVFFVSSNSFRHEAKLFILCRKRESDGNTQVQPFSTVAVKNANV